MGTQLLYLDHTDLLEATAILKSIGKDERGDFAILDRTIAYPQGGGQASDRGYISNGEIKAPLMFVGYVDEDVRHYIPSQLAGDMRPGQRIDIFIEPANRLENAALHTAGHLITHLVECAQPDAVPQKGYHFNNGSYVEFSYPDEFDFSAVISSLNAALTQVLAQGLSIESRLASFEEVANVRPTLAPLIPKNKPTRIVTFGNYKPLPCGGTHLPDLTKFSEVRISKAKRSKQSVRFSYDVRMGSALP